VKSFQGYIVNGYRFHTNKHAKGRKSENHGVYVKGSENENSGVDYYGVLKEVLEVQFVGHLVMSAVFLSMNGLTLHQIEAGEYTFNVSWLILTVRRVTQI
jgi:hypothetical protein